MLNLTSTTVSHWQTNAKHNSFKNKHRKPYEMDLIFFQNKQKPQIASVIRTFSSAKSVFMIVQDQITKAQRQKYVATNFLKILG